MKKKTEVAATHLGQDTAKAATQAVSEVNRTFSEGTNALYLCLQIICPDCNKLVRISLLTNEMTKVKQ